MERTKLPTAILLSSIIAVSMAWSLNSCSTPDQQVIDSQDQLWPDTKKTMKPWTRWWWHGNAVDKQNITRRLEEFAAAGIGGVEITPIFGVKGYEDRFIDHLSPEWMEMLIHTLDQAERLGLGVDMVQGTGWPFGGPQVQKEHAAGKIHIQSYNARANEKFSQRITLKDPEQAALAELQYLFAFDRDGTKTDLMGQLDGDLLSWTPAEDQEVFAVFNGKTGQQVKRSAPGGEGFVLDHFSKEALEEYMAAYDETLAPVKGRLRALFNDSYEVYHSDYTPELFREFNERRGYDFTDHLRRLAHDTTSEESLRILGDYRQTMADLVLEDMSENWVAWAGEHSFLTKYQAHGCPGNLLDIYASADIPECESFYATAFDIPGLRREESDARQAYPDLILLKFASSAAHISGKPLTSSETLTWLREHFKTALSQCKPEIEQLLLSGVNHVFFHGSTYFPDEAPWPGWKFYASVNFVPTYTIWKDASYMFDYIARCQSILQSGVSDNEILVYWPFHDVIYDDLGAEILLQLGIDNKDEWLVPTSFHRLVRELIDKGYSVDFISDRYLEKTGVSDGMIKSPGRDYRALVVPDSRHMPASTMESLVSLNSSGGNVVFEGLPETVPGYHNFAERTERLLGIIEEAGSGIRVTEDINATLVKEGIRGEGLKEHGLDFVRRSLEDGKAYYLVNHTPEEVDGFTSISTRAGSVVIMDPLTGKAGKATIKKGKNGTQVYLQMKPGDALILRTFDHPIAMEPWNYSKTTGDPVEIGGTWEIEFLSGGPEIPESATLEGPGSWTALGSKAEAFSGTARYTIRFENPDPGVESWRLQLGDVRESARIRLNGQELGCLWSVPFETGIGALKEGTNTLEIEVTNLSANRMRDLELKGTEWKIFYEINMVNRHYETFDATIWDPMPSGLLGPLTLSPARNLSQP